MALIPSTLSTSLGNLYDQMQTYTDPALAKAYYIQQMATIIDTYVRSATVNVTVVTTGTAAAQTGTGVGSLS